jgi:hypothetical protein
MVVASHGFGVMDVGGFMMYAKAQHMWEYEVI